MKYNFVQQPNSLNAKLFIPQPRKRRASFGKGPPLPFDLAVNAGVAARGSGGQVLHRQAKVRLYICGSSLWINGGLHLHEKEAI
jgi:hypothetical protein